MAYTAWPGKCGPPRSQRPRVGPERNRNAPLVVPTMSTTSPPRGEMLRMSTIAASEPFRSYLGAHPEQSRSGTSRSSRIIPPVQATSTPRVKICCIRSVEEAWTAIRHGASALGLVSKMPSGPGAIPDEDIAAIAAAVPPPVATFLLTSRQDAASIIEQQRRLRTTTVQVCDRLEREAYAELRR